ncbi:MAG: large conductance mechanosensitive channel protein MscL [Coriobacteriales bacterium]|jgi:large conductance mechanosensitive channel|nr:large conductance mechanosensitive channel protein MscL [Coriobacteriales bacterium]
MRKLYKEFKEFVDRGNVMDLAVAVIMGAAFTAIINAVVGDLVTPLLSLLTLGIDFDSLRLTIGSGDNAAVIKYGSLISAIINFLVVSIVVFFMVKGINKLSRKKPAPEESTKTCDYCAEEIPKAALRCPQCTTILDSKNFPPDLH